MNRFLLLLPILLLFLCFCNKQNDAPSPEPTATNHISLTSPEVGQTSKYLVFDAGFYINQLDTVFTYSDDTLIAEILVKDPKGYLVREHFAYVDSLNLFLNNVKDGVAYYYIQPEDDSLKFLPITGYGIPSSFIFNYQIMKNGLRWRDYTIIETTIKGWRVNLPYDATNKLAFVSNAAILGSHYDHLNVLVINSGLAWDSNGYTYLYNKSEGIVRMSTYGEFTSWGIDLLP